MREISWFDPSESFEEEEDADLPARKRPSAALEEGRELICDLVARHKAANPRVFGSVARGEDTPESDLDLLVDPPPGATLFDPGRLQEALEEALGVRVDLATPGNFDPDIRDRILRSSVPVLAGEGDPPPPAEPMTRMEILELDLKQIRKLAGPFARVVEEGLEAWRENRMAQAAAIFSFTRISGVAARIEKKWPGFEAANPEIPWEDLHSLRKLNAEDPFAIDPGWIWELLENHLPALLGNLAPPPAS